MNLHGRPDTQPTLEAAEIVIDDVTLDHTDQFLPAGEASSVVPFPLEDPPEALHGAVVDAFSHSGHALRNAGCGQLVVEDLSGIGAAPVAVEQGADAWGGFQRQVQGAMDQRGVVGIPDEKGDDPPVAQIQNGAQLELVHDGTHIVMKLGHIGEPLLIGAVCVKTALQHILRQMTG